MAHMSKKGEWFIARFTWDGKEYKKSLKMKDDEDAKAALRDIENRIHDLHRNKTQVPTGVDPGDFIVWGETANGTTSVGVLREQLSAFIRSMPKSLSSVTMQHRFIG